MHLSKIFKPNSREFTLEKNKLPSDVITIAILNIPAKFFAIKEVKLVIKNLNPKNFLCGHTAGNYCIEEFHVLGVVIQILKK